MYPKDIGKYSFKVKCSSKWENKEKMEKQSMVKNVVDEKI
jgi:hypothetical protein